MSAHWEESRKCKEFCVPVSLFTELVQSHAGLARKTKRSRLALGDICPLGQSLAFGLERFSVDGTG